MRGAERRRGGGGRLTPLLSETSASPGRIFECDLCVVTFELGSRPAKRNVKFIPFRFILFHFISFNFVLIILYFGPSLLCFANFPFQHPRRRPHSCLGLAKPLDSCGAALQRLIMTPTAPPTATPATALMVPLDTPCLLLTRGARGGVAALD